MRVRELAVAGTLGVATVSGVVAATVGAGALGNWYGNKEARDSNVEDLSSLAASDNCGTPYASATTADFEARLAATDFGARIGSVALQECATDVEGPYTQLVITVTHPQGDVDLTAPIKPLRVSTEDIGDAISGIDATERDRLDSDLTLPIGETARLSREFSDNSRWFGAIGAAAAFLVGSAVTHRIFRAHNFKW